MLIIVLTVLPVFFAGLVFILTLRYFPKLLKYPLDFGRFYLGKRIFGANKTFAGPVLMGIFTGVFGLVLINLLSNPLHISKPFFLYVAIGLLYSLGELPNSFVKRRLDILPGKSHTSPFIKNLFKIVDIYDGLIFCGIGYIALFRFDSLNVVISVLIGGIFHYFTDLFMKALKLK